MSVTTSQNNEDAEFQRHHGSSSPQKPHSYLDFTQCPSHSPAKRKFDPLDVTDTDDPPSKTPKTFIKDKDHWFLDGNLLIQIGDNRFKIHQSRMIRESPWFKALIEQRAKGVPKETYEYQAEINTALESVEQYEGIDLFYLDFPGGPNALQFRRLLTAMEGGIDYVFNQPGFRLMVDIYIAARFFCARRYIQYVESLLENKFPDSLESLQDLKRNPSPRAARALLLGLKFDIDVILRRCYYDIARTHPLPLPAGDGIDEANDKPSILDLQNASSSTFFRLMNIQRELALAWDKILDILQYQCSSAGVCRIEHQGYRAYKKAKDEYLFDPIMGIQSLLEDGLDLNQYCSASKLDVRIKLIKERDKIWTNMKAWANIE